MSQQVKVGEKQAERSDRVLIGIPAYNEEATIGSVVLQGFEYGDRVLVVDDGSTDRTVEIARRAGATVLEQPANRGKGAAVQRIFEYARESDIDQLIILDADWQHDPGEIPDLLSRFNEMDADIVIGSRYVDGDRGDTPLYRRAGQKVLDYVTYLGTGTTVTDSQSGYRAFNRDAIEQIEIDENGFGVETEMLQSASDNDLTVTESPISVNYDVPDPNTSNSILHGVNVIDTFLGIVRDRHPLLFFGVPGATLMVLGLGYGAWTVSIYQSGGGFYVGKALFSAVLFLVGMFSFYSALIMNMLGNRLDT